MARWTSIYALLNVALAMSLAPTGFGAAAAERQLVRVRGGGWLWGKTTEQKGEAAKKHAGKAYMYGKDYTKDRVYQGKDKVKDKYLETKRKAAETAKEGERKLKHAEEQVAKEYDSVKSHAKSVAEQAKEKAKSSYQEAKDKTKAEYQEVKDKTWNGYQEARAKAGAAATVAERKAEAGAQRTKGFLGRVRDFFTPPPREGHIIDDRFFEEDSNGACTVPSYTTNTVTSYSDNIITKEPLRIKAYVDNKHLYDDIFEVGRQLIADRPRLPACEQPKSFGERYAEEKAQTLERQRTWGW